MSGKEVIRAISQLLQNVAKGLTSEDYHRLMLAIYRKLGLVDKSDQWRSEVLSDISETLLPKNLENAEVSTFIEDVERYALLNPYLIDFLTEAAKLPLTVLHKKVAAEGDVVFPDVIAYALLLQRLTTAEKADWRVLEACYNIWNGMQMIEESRKRATLFDRFKRFSVNRFAVATLGFYRTGIVDPKFARVLVPENTLEAMLEDFRLGFRRNASCGWVLTKNRPANCDVINPVTGEGPTEWTPDKKGLVIRYPLPRLWSDLYSTWNMAFLSKYGSFPYKLVNLLIPVVNNYADTPDGFLYNRALALYTHLHFSGLGGPIMLGGEAMQWEDKALSRLWGEVNKRSAATYQQTLNAARKTGKAPDIHSKR